MSAVGKVGSRFRCSQHPEQALVDVAGSGTVIAQDCPRCVPLVLVDVVRQLFVRRDVEGAGQ